MQNATAFSATDTAVRLTTAVRHPDHHLTEFLRGEAYHDADALIACAIAAATAAPRPAAIDGLRSANYLASDVNPMCAVIGQNAGERVHVLDEIVLPQSDTWQLCHEFLRRVERWVNEFGGPVNVYVYGDASGSSRHSSADERDWQIVERALGRAGRLCRAQLRVPKQNPSVKMRVNAVNGMLRNQRQERKLLIHPQCRQLIKDFERVSWAADANGNILPQMDKSDPMRTHVSDALGYKLADESDLVQHGRVIKTGLF